MSYRAIRRTVLFGIVAAWALAYLCPALAQTLNDPKLHVREVTSGLSQPTAMAFIGPGDILVLQKGDGRVRRVINGMLQPGHVLDVAVDNASERGLLGIAVHPNFPSTPFVYLYFTQSSTSGDTPDLQLHSQTAFIAIRGMGTFWSAPLSFWICL